MIILLSRWGDTRGVRGALVLYGFGLPFLLFAHPRTPNLIVAALIGLDLASWWVANSLPRRRAARNRSAPRRLIAQKTAALPPISVEQASLIMLSDVRRTDLQILSKDNGD